jgi:pimeloyl-ACP methyl ester carboxylesterase
VSDGVLLLHAWPVDARMWDAERAALDGRGIATAAPNLPGFGGAPPVGDVMTMGEAATAALEALDRAAITRAVVVGCSIGGYVAFEVWRRARERVGGLGLVNTRAVADAPEASAARRDLAARLLGEGSGFLVSDPPPLLSEAAPQGLGDRVRSWIAEQPAAAIAAASLGMAERPDSTPDLPGIDVPSLVVTADGDRLIPPEVSLAMADHLPDVRTAVLSGAGHLSNLEQPSAFLGAIDGLLERCDLPGGT